MKQREFKLSSHPLYGYLPSYSIQYIDRLVKDLNVHFKVVRPRKTKLGDCRFPRKKQDQIVVTINQDLDQFQFLITSLHELAHAKTFQLFGNKIPAHGKEWKQVFSNILKDFSSITSPSEEERMIIESMAKRPKSTSFGSEELQHFLKQENSIFLKDLANGTVFNFKNKEYRKTNFLRTYALCTCTATKRQYKIHGMVEISRTS